MAAKENVSVHRSGKVRGEYKRER